MFDNNPFKQYAVALLAAEEQCKQDKIVRVEIFEQTRPSTALGFGGVGGSMITTTPTIVVETTKCIRVFFNGRFAYTIRPNREHKYKDEVTQDLFIRRDPVSVKDNSKYM